MHISIIRESNFIYKAVLDAGKRPEARSSAIKANNIKHLYAIL